MFTETVIMADGSVTTGTATEEHALGLLRKAVRRSYRMEATRTGGVIVTRDVWTGDTLPKRHTIVLEPVTPVRALTPATRRNLEAIGADREAYLVAAAEVQFRARVGHISAGFSGLSPAVSRRLTDRGLVTLGEPYRSTSNGFLPETRRPVRLSLAARLAMLAQDHRTHTLAPAGYVKPLDMGRNFIGRNSPRGGVTYDRRSPAGCSCREWSATSGDGRDDARRMARGHREKMARELVMRVV